MFKVITHCAFTLFFSKYSTLLLLARPFFCTLNSYGIVTGNALLNVGLLIKVDIVSH